jgi:hypothetical protein
MAMIKTILVRGSDEQLKVVRVPQWHLELVLDVDAETALEGVRRYFLNRWGAKVHALQWLFPEDLLLSRNQEQTPFLVLWVETLGRVPVDSIKDPAQTRPAYNGSDGLAPFLVAAETPCHSEPWSLPSWLPSVAKWIRAHFLAIRRVSQVRTCPNGAVVRIECVNGVYYLKTQLQPLAYESALLMILNRRIPGVCPQVLPIRPDANTYLTEAIVGSPMNVPGDSQSWRATLSDVAKIQIESADFVTELCHGGVPYHGLAALGAGIEEMLNRLIASQNGSPNELTLEELRKISSLISKAAPDFEVLYRCDLPETLIHGDLNQSNAFRTGTGRTVLIDWALSRVTHPFFTLGSALFGPYASGRRKQPDYDDLCNAYLEPWRDFQAHDRLRAALDAASRLFWIDSTMAVSSLCQPGHVRNLINLPRFLRATLRAYELLG